MYTLGNAASVNSSVLIDLWQEPHSTDYHLGQCDTKESCKFLRAKRSWVQIRNSVARKETSTPKVTIKRNMNSFCKKMWVVRICVQILKLVRKSLLQEWSSCWASAHYISGSCIYCLMGWCDPAFEWRSFYGSSKLSYPKCNQKKAITWLSCTGLSRPASRATPASRERGLPVEEMGQRTSTPRISSHQPIEQIRWATHSCTTIWLSRHRVRSVRSRVQQEGKL